MNFILALDLQGSLRLLIDFSLNDLHKFWALTDCRPEVMTSKTIL